jgi:hypothetical protein
MAIGKYLEEQLRAFLGEGHIAQFISSLTSRLSNSGAASKSNPSKVFIRGNLASRIRRLSRLSARVSISDSIRETGKGHPSI